MGNVEVGSVFHTGNAVVSQLPVGTVLQVVGQGQVRVGALDVVGAEPEEEVCEPQLGDDIIVTNKNNRLGMIVRAGINLGVTVGDDEVLYYSDSTGEPVIRRAKKTDIIPA